MDNFKSFKSLLQNLNDSNVADIALRLFRYQAKYNPIYSQFIQYLNVNPASVNSIFEIPFLPISFFKSHVLKTEEWTEEVIFKSSGTTGKYTSQHYIVDQQFYFDHAERCFEHFFGPLSQYHFLAIMPSYLEQKDSSLVAMIRSFIQKSGSADSGFYLYDYEKVVRDIERLKSDATRKIIVWGVSFALLDLAEKYNPDLSGCMVFETGGMKGRRKELTRTELHGQLKSQLHIDKVYSEYGMTELLSQAYSSGAEVFSTPPSLKILIRDILDPLEKGLVNKVGGVNIIDFANFHSIAFIETEDMGKVFEDGTFEIVGRLDNSDVRGCNLMVE